MYEYFRKDCRTRHVVYMTRRQERETVFQLLFETEFHRSTPPSDLYAGGLSAQNIKDTAYIRDTYFGAVEHARESDEEIALCAHNWKVSRMAVVTKSILRLAVYEMMWGGIPPKAVINEAVELAKVYDDDAAPAFINGILNRIARKNGLIPEEDGASGGDAQ